MATMNKNDLLIEIDKMDLETKIAIGMVLNKIVQQEQQENASNLYEKLYPNEKAK